MFPIVECPRRGWSAFGGICGIGGVAGIGCLDVERCAVVMCWNHGDGCRRGDGRSCLNASSLVD